MRPREEQVQKHHPQSLQSSRLYCRRSWQVRVQPERSYQRHLVAVLRRYSSELFGHFVGLALALCQELAQDSLLELAPVELVVVVWLDLVVALSFSCLICYRLYYSTTIYITTTMS